MAELDRLLPDNAITVADASYSTIWMASICGPAARVSGSSHRGAWPGSAGDCRWR